MEISVWNYESMPLCDEWVYFMEEKVTRQESPGVFILWEVIFLFCNHHIHCENTFLSLQSKCQSC